MSRLSYIRSGDGIRLRMAAWGDPMQSVGTVLVLQGRTESIEKYHPVAEKFVSKGYFTASLDWRGQGLSERLLEDKHIGHVDKFSDYQHDVAAVFEFLSAQNAPKPWFLLAHSMGGAIGLRALLAGADVAAAAFSGPMWGINIPGPLLPIAWVLRHLSQFFSNGRRYAPFTSSVQNLLQIPFENNKRTGDRGQYAWMQNLVRCNPDLLLAAPSLAWLREALVECGALMTARPVPVPLLALAGAEEQIVSLRRIKKRVASWPGASLHLIPHARHEIFFERPALRAEALKRVVTFFEAHRNAFA